MTEILDSQGNRIEVGARVLDDDGCEEGTVIEISDPDGDTNSYGRIVGIPPMVTVRYDDALDSLGVDVYSYRAEWNASGPWDDHRDDYTCDDLTVAVDQREPDGYRTEAGRIVPTDR